MRIDEGKPGPGVTQESHRVGLRARITRPLSRTHSGPPTPWPIWLRLFLVSLLSFIHFPATPRGAIPGAQGPAQQEEKRDYYAKWLKEDVVYIISPEEEEIFRNLSTDEEKERFIEQFWLRRDPDLRTSVNEFKEEHYRRIAYANDQFTWALPGWTSDRGRIYIVHGPPAQVEDHSGGGDYNRPMSEGGGSTVTYPFYIWRYRYVEGIGTDVQLEFVDKCMCGQFSLALRPEEKDALLNTPSMGLTEAEMMGAAERKERPYYNTESRIPGLGSYPFMAQRYQDHPFVRYERYMNIGKAPEIKYKDLREIVEVNLSYEHLPFQVREDQFRLSGDRVIVPVTVEFANRDLTFQREGKRDTAKLGIYGLVTNLFGKIVAEFEDDLSLAYAPEQLPAGLAGLSAYQRILVLEGNGRYKLDLVLKDLRSGKAGVLRRAIVPVQFNDSNLQIGSLIVSDKIEQLASLPDRNEMFVLGDIKVRPSVRNAFSRSGDLGLYSQVYNATIDQSTDRPVLELTYRILRDGIQVAEKVDEAGESVQFFSAQRTVLVQRLPIEGMPPGEYTLELIAHDKVLDEKAHASQVFRVVD